MGWRDRLAAARAAPIQEESPPAICAKSAKSLSATPSGTIGTFDIGVFPCSEAPQLLAEREAVANEPEPASRTVRACCYCSESGDGCDTCGDEPKPDRTPQPPPDEKLEEAATTDFKKVLL